ncbi:MAG: SEC-C metal-binding domain-containing protein [Waddliaceae bacterium]
MDKKVGRNDPCPCGSGKKYKQCCLKKKLPGGGRKFSAKIIKSGVSLHKQEVDLMERTFGSAIQAAAQAAPSLPSEDKDSAVEDASTNLEEEEKKQ